MLSDAPRVRYAFIDELRGAAVLCMIFYHAFFTVGVIFGYKAGLELLDFFTPAEPAFAFLFIALSGFCTRFSHSVARRGAQIALCAVAVTVATAAAGLFGLDITIWFGVLHLIASAMLIWAALRPALLKIHPAAGLVLSLFLFLATFNLQNRSLGIEGLLTFTLPDRLFAGGIWTVFGFPAFDFSSGDYLPLLPWLFAFFAGGFAGRIKPGPLPKFFEKKRLPPLDFLGRHSLWVYILHQPVIYLLCAAADAII